VGLVTDIDINLSLQVAASKTKIYMVLEFVNGGELFDKIVSHQNYIVNTVCLHVKLVSHPFDTFFCFPCNYSKAIKGKLSEHEGRRLFQQLIDGVSYCHDKGVYHRDLKVFT